LRGIALFLGVLVALAGCGGGRGGDEASGTATAGRDEGGDLSGRIEADGSSTVGPYATAAAERFQAVQPGRPDHRSASPARAAGFERFCRGENRPLERVAPDQGRGGEAL
jgi:phosphate transport system substrate-binding protein